MVGLGWTKSMTRVISSLMSRLPIEKCLTLTFLTPLPSDCESTAQSVACKRPAFGQTAVTVTHLVKHDIVTLIALMPNSEFGPEASQSLSTPAMLQSLPANLAVFTYRIL